MVTKDARLTCVVCAWRGECTKKFKNTDDALHCPDYCRDVRLPPDDELGMPEKEGPGAKRPGKFSQRFKNVEDPFDE